MATRRDEGSKLLTPSLLTLDIRLQAVEQSVAAFKHQFDDIGADVEYVKKYNSIRNEVVKQMNAAIKVQQTSLDGIETRLASTLERAVEKSCGELYRLQRNADERQHDWHTAVTQDFQDAHSRIEAQVTSLREKAEDATAATRKMIEKEVFKMDALSANMLNRVNTLTEQHEAVQAALQDVVARQKDVKRASQRMSGRVSHTSVVTDVPDVDVVSERSTEPPFSSESSRRGFRHVHPSSDEGSGLDSQSQKMQRQIKDLNHKFYRERQAGWQRQQHRDRSSSRESSRLHHRMNHISSGIRHAQASATRAHKSVTELKFRQEFHEALASAFMQELVYMLERESEKIHGEQAHGVSREQIAARALLWQMLSNHEKRVAAA